MLKKVKDLTVYEAWVIANKHCVCQDTWDGTCSKCPFNSKEEQKENCPLCNSLFSEVGDLEEKDLEKTVEVDGEDYVQTIYANGEVYMTVEDKDAKIRMLQAEITKLLSDKQYLKDKVDRFKILVDGYQYIIKDLVD